MKPAPFSYLRADSVDEACAALGRYGEDARILAGGQSLGAMLNMRLVTPAVVVDINRVSDLARIEARDGVVTTGATVRQADALHDRVLTKHVPLLAAALPHVGHFQTRSRGTLGGSVAHADPSAEIPLVLAVLDGEIDLRSARRRRRVRARDFFRSALVTDRAPDEMVVALHWPASTVSGRHGFREFAMRTGDYALVAAACDVRLSAAGTIERLSLGFAGCSARPQIFPAGAYEGRQVSRTLPAEIAKEAATLIECKSDLHAPAQYRRQLVRTLAESLLEQALS